MDYSRESAYRSQMSGDERGESLSAESYSEKHLSRIDEANIKLKTEICCVRPRARANHFAMHGYHPLDIKNGSDTATAHVAVITAVVLVLGLFARWMDHRKRWRSSHLSGFAAVADMGGQWERKGSCKRIFARVLRLHSLTCLFCPPPRLLSRGEEAVASLGVLLMAFAFFAAMMSQSGDMRFRPIQVLVMTIYMTFFVNLLFVWPTRIFFSFGSANTCSGTCMRVCAWIYFLLIYATLSLFYFMYGTKFGPEDTAALASVVLSSLVENWLFWEPVVVIVISVSMEFCACCRCTCCQCCQEHDKRITKDGATVPEPDPEADEQPTEP